MGIKKQLVELENRLKRSSSSMNRKKASRQEMSADDLIGFAKQFVNLGSSVQEQLVDLMEGRYDDINPNAVKLMKQKLSGYHEEIDDVIERALRRSEEEE